MHSFLSFIKISLVAVLLLMVFHFDGNCNHDYSKVDNKSRAVPDSVNTVEKISGFLTKDLTAERDKVRAIYFWIANNIRYDVELYRNTYRDTIPKKTNDDVIKTRLGVCQHYADLFNAMCQYAGIKSYVISGYTKGSDMLSDEGHAWNIVMIDSVFYNLDVTWAAGYLKDDKFVPSFKNKWFLVAPKEFIKTHIPFDPVWQLLDNPYTHTELINENFKKEKAPGNFKFKDSIAKLDKMDALENLKNVKRRILAAGLTNNCTRQQFEMYNAQISNKILAAGVQNYNLYVEMRNKGFRNPKVEDDKIKELIFSAEKNLFEAKVLVEALTLKENELYIAEVKKFLPGIINDIEREKAFVERYVKTKKFFRPFFLF